MEKPTKWYSNRKKRKLSPEAKAYLSFKLTRYWKLKKEKEEFKEDEKKDFPVRVWCKMVYKIHNKPLFIEAFIDGMYSQKDKLESILFEQIEKSFNDAIAERCEFGLDRIPYSDGRMEVRYKENLTSRWSYMR